MSNVFEKLQSARVKLQNAKLKKTGKNAYAGFNYFELADFIPTVNNIFDELKLCSNFSILEGVAKLTIINSEKPEELTTFTMPTTELQLKGCTAIQALGGVNTYCRRYLYLNALEIVENDLLDGKAGTFDKEEPKKVKTNNDVDIIEGLKACDNMANLVKYKDKYKDQVTDVEAFKSEYAKLYKQFEKEVK